MKRNVVIDLLRFFAALFVVFFHLYGCGPKMNNWYFKIVCNGWTGVPIFFVISGYCVTLSAHKSKSSIDFIFRRFFRIFPLYWVSLLFSFFFLIIRKSIIGVNSIAHIPHTFLELIYNIFNLTLPFSKVEPINWVYWTLTVELFFYLMIYLSAIFNKKFNVYIIAIITIASFFNYLSLFQPLFFLEYWPAFGIGSALFLTQKNQGFQKIFSILLLILNVVALFFANKSQGNVPYIIVVLITVALIFFSEYITIKENFISKLGDYSYGVYLLHVPLGVYCIGSFKENLIKGNLLLRILIDIILYLITLFLSRYLYRWIEKPAVAFGNTVNKKYFQNN